MTVSKDVISALSLFVSSILFGILAAALQGRASKIESSDSHRYAYHTFEFGLFNECPGVEVIDYKYGKSNLTGTRPDNANNQVRHIPQSEHVSGNLPIGEFLYVKWKVVSTGKFYEQTVNLRGRLPLDMDHKVLHFSVVDEQLYIHVIEGEDKAALHDSDAPDCVVSSYGIFKCATIYPEYWSNFKR